MSTEPVVHDTFVINKHYPATPARVFSAFSDPDRKRRWFAEGPGFQVDSHALDFRVGGTEVSHFRMLGAPLPDGTPVVNHTWYTDIVPNQRIVFAYTMTVDGKRISSSQTTVELEPDGGDATRLRFTEQVAFFADADGIEMREAGTRQLLDQLGKEITGTLERQTND